MQRSYYAFMQRATFDQRNGSVKASGLRPPVGGEHYVTIPREVRRHFQRPTLTLHRDGCGVMLITNIPACKALWAYVDIGKEPLGFVFGLRRGSAGRRSAHSARFLCEFWQFAM